MTYNGCIGIVEGPFEAFVFNQSAEHPLVVAKQKEGAPGCKDEGRRKPVASKVVEMHIEMKMPGKRQKRCIILRDQKYRHQRMSTYGREGKRIYTKPPTLLSTGTAVLLFPMGDLPISGGK